MRFVLLFALAVPAWCACAASWTNGYTFCQEITIDHTKVASDQTNFPMVVCLGSAIGSNCSTSTGQLATLANGGKLHNANGYDVIFTSDSAGTTPIAYERAIQDLTTGASEFWVLIASLSSTVDTKIYLFYGNSLISTDQSNPTAVWDSHFIAVNHFNQLTGTYITAPDSTSFGNTLTDGVPGRISGISGKIGGGATWTGSAAMQNVSPTGMPSGSNPKTLEAWALLVASANPQFVNCIGHNATDQRFAIWLSSTPSQWALEGTNVAVGTSPASAPTGSWQHLVVTLPSGSTTFMGAKIYLDGVSQTTANIANWTDTVNTVLGNYMVGGICDIGANIDNGAKVDESRVSDIARSADWISTEYNNQNSPNTFYTLGAANVFTGIGGPRPVIFK